MKKILFTFILWNVLLCSLVAQSRIIVPDSLRGKLSSASVDESLPKDGVRQKEDMRDKGNMKAQKSHEHSEMDSILAAVRIFTWNIDPRTGTRYATPLDTVYPNYQQTTLPDGYFVASGFLGPLGSPIFSKIFFDQPEKSHFLFSDAYFPYNREPKNHVFFNTAIPYSRLTYQRGGGGLRNEEHFKALFTLNANRHLNFGLDGGIIMSKGFYNSQSVKHSTWNFHGNYLSDRIEAHLLASTSQVTNFENGGITDEAIGFITRPDTMTARFTSRDIPIRHTQTWNRVKSDHLMLTARYNVGYRKKTFEGDSVAVQKEEFVPVASMSVSSRFNRRHRRFLSYDTSFVDVDGVQMQRIDQFYKNRYYDGGVDDSVSYTSFKNSVALSLREGFKPWVKFGLTAFLQHEVRNFTMINEKDKTGRLHYRENAVTIGGVLDKQQGEHLRFNIQADLGLIGANLGEFRAMGTVETGIDIAGKRTTLTGEAYLKNLKPKYFEQNYHSKYFWWDNDFGDTRRVYVGGKLFIPFTNTMLRVGVENIQNYIYIDKDKQVTQTGDNIQVLSAGIDQKIQFGIFHWDNQLVYQTSSNQEAIPLPQLSVYSNIYLKTRIISDFMLQFGLDAHYHTRYFAPGYEPALLQFYNQQETKVGNYPIATIYANMRLKRTRFFVMMYNVAPYVWKPSEYFSLPGYPVNPSVIKLGLVWDLHN